VQLEGLGGRLAHASSSAMVLRIPA